MSAGAQGEEVEVAARALPSKADRRAYAARAAGLPEEVASLITADDLPGATAQAERLAAYARGSGGAVSAVESRPGLPSRPRARLEPVFFVPDLDTDAIAIKVLREARGDYRAR